MNYYETLIAVADDCPVDRSEVPPQRGAKPSIARLQYELLIDDPYSLTQEDVLFTTWLRRQPDAVSQEADVESLREAFFSQPRACLRASPLPKRYGWGLLFDRDGKLSLCPMESDEYDLILRGERPSVKVIKAMRSKRA